VPHRLQYRPFTGTGVPQEAHFAGLGPDCSSRPEAPNEFGGQRSLVEQRDQQPSGAADDADDEEPVVDLVQGSIHQRIEDEQRHAGQAPEPPKLESCLYAALQQTCYCRRHE
jgi:hypothetical protein